MSVHEPTAIDSHNVRPADAHVEMDNNDNKISTSNTNVQAEDRHNSI